MKKISLLLVVFFLSFNAAASSVFYGSLYMLDSNGNAVANPKSSGSE